MHFLCANRAHPICMLVRMRVLIVCVLLVFIVQILALLAHAIIIVAQMCVLILRMLFFIAAHSIALNLRMQ